MSRAAAIAILVLQMVAVLLVAGVPLAPSAEAQQSPPSFPGIKMFPAPWMGHKQVYTVGSADGGVTGVRFVFNGTIDAIALHADYFTITGCNCLNPRIEVPRNQAGFADNFTLWFEPEMPSSIRPVLTYHHTSGSAGAVVAPIRSIANIYGYTTMDEGQVQALAAVDAVPPSILDAVTMDLDNDGLIDAYCITFTEDIRDTSFKIGQWSVAGTVPKAPVVEPLCSNARDTADSVDDALLTLPFEPKAFLHSGSLPQLTYTLVGNDGLRDLTFGNSMQDVGPSRVFERDGVRARLVRAYAEEGSSEVVLVFSEPIRHKGGGNLLAADFTYAKGGIACPTCIAAVTQPAAGSSIVKLTLEGPVTAADLGADSIAPRITAGPDACCLEDLATPTANPVLNVGQPLTVDLETPAQVSNVPIPTTGSTTATVTWTSPSAVDLDHIEIRRFPQGQNTPWDEMTFVANVTGIPSTVQSYTLTGLDMDRSYEVALVAVDASGNPAECTDGSAATACSPVRTTFRTVSASAGGGAGSSSSSSSTTTPPPGTGPPAVTKLDGLPGGKAAQSLAFSWNGTATTYDVRYGPIATPPTAPVFDQGSRPAAQVRNGAWNAAWITGLQPDTSYWVGVRGYSVTGAAGPAGYHELRTGPAASTPPAPALTSNSHPAGIGSTSGNATLEWTMEASIQYRYLIDAAPGTQVGFLDGNATSPLALGGLAAGTHRVLVAAFGPGGSATSAFDVLVDRTPPGALAAVQATPQPAAMGFSWTLPSDAGLGAQVLVRHKPGSGGEAWEDFGGEVILPAGGGNVTRLLPEATYSFALRVRDGAGNPGPMTIVTEVTTLPDTTPPIGLPEVTVGDRADGLAIGPTVQLAWTPAEDAETLVHYRYAFVDDPSHALGDGDATTAEAAVSLEDLTDGTYTFLLRAESAGGHGETVSQVVEVHTVTPAELQMAIGAIELRVERRGDANQLAWTLPNLTVPPAGVQVWASNSPYQLLTDLSGSAASGSFVHTGEASKASTRYLVTIYYGAQPALGWYEPGDAPDTTKYPGSAVPQPRSLLDYAPWAIGALLAAGAVAAGVAWLLRRRRWAQPPSPVADPAIADEMADWQAAGDGVEPMAEPPADVRDVACYQCSTVYAAVGALPLQTTCPSCGAQGMLGA